MGTREAGAEAVLRIEKAVAGGDMIARLDGQVIFVAGAIPGERVRVRIDRVGRGFARGLVVEVLEPHPDRRDAVVDPGCGGRAYAHVRYPRQFLLKQAIIGDAFRRIAHLTVTVQLVGALQAFDLFPNTAHVQTVVALQRSGG